MLLVTHFLTQVDEFTGKLWEIYETIKSEGGPVQVMVCCWQLLRYSNLFSLNSTSFQSENT